MVENTIKSPAFSFSGWNFKDWLLGNGKTIKELVKVLVPLGVAWASTRNPALLTVFTLLGKLVLDSFEYWIKEKKA
jgi:hypothetical protein